MQENFTRDHALKAYELLDKHNLKLPIYTNHGNGNIASMRHNIGFEAYHEASKKESSVYHMDLFKQHGGAYVWSDDWVHEDKEGISLNGTFTRLGDGRQRGRDSLIERLLCGDDYYLFFKRYRSTGLIAPNFQTFNHQIESIDWDDFCDHAKAVILYQHLGSFCASYQGHIPTTVELCLKFPIYLKGFYFLKEKQDQGDILMMSTYELLSYVDMYMNTKPQSIIHEGSETITLFHHKQQECVNIFDGLTLYVDDPRRRICVMYENQSLKFIRNGLDMRGRYSITIDSQKGMYDVG